MSTRMSWGLVAVVLVGLSPAAHAQKKMPPPPDWPCIIEFRTAVAGSDDKIQGDGQGPYVQGQEAVQCIVRRSGGNDGNLFVNASRSSPRFLAFPAHASVDGTSAYAYFENRQPGYFEITDIDTVAYTTPTADRPDPNAAQLRRVRVGIGGTSQFEAGEFWGDSLATDPLTAGTHSATVVATGPCSWTVSWDAGTAAVPRVVALREGPARARVRVGDFVLPFSATVTVIGVKPGCPAP